MNKAQLIDAIAEKAGLTKADSKKALEAFVATIGESLKKDEKVALVGFGSFSVSERSARAGRNPQTGICLCKGKRTSNAHTCRASRTDHEEL